MRSAGFFAWRTYLDELERIARREGKYEIKLSFEGLWAEVSEETIRNRFHGNPVRREFLSKSSFRSTILDQLCREEAGLCFEGSLRAALGVQAISDSAFDRTRQLAEELERAVAPQKEKEINALELSEYRGVREELLIGQWYELAKGEGWDRSNLRQLGQAANDPVVTKESAQGMLAVCGMEHSSTNLKFGRLPIFLDVMIDGQFQGAHPRLLLRGMEAYETFQDGASAALGMLAYLQLAQEILAVLPPDSASPNAGR